MLNQTKISFEYTFSWSMYHKHNMALKQLRDVISCCVVVATQHFPPEYSRRLSECHVLLFDYENIILVKQMIFEWGINSSNMPFHFEYKVL